MLTSAQQEHILTRAYVPEHLVGLMTRVSGGEPYLVEDFFCCRKDDFMIVVGYPLERPFTVHLMEAILDRVTREFAPRRISFIAPEIPPSFGSSCIERESDSYFVLELGKARYRSNVKRAVRKARENSVVERGTLFTSDHQELTEEFVERVRPHPRVRELLFRMPNYVGHSDRAIVLNAWRADRKLAAFSVVDLSAKNFSTYVIGAHSKKHQVPGAPDLLFKEMIDVTQDCDKSYIHLGLGVNEGIRGFKKKWGGIPTLPYEMCEIAVRKPSFVGALLAYATKR
jgi:hypothetical protein